MTEFVYNNAKNASIVHTSLELNYGYHPRVFFKEDIDFYLIVCSTNKLAEKLRELMEVCCQNLLYTQELQKRAYDKGVKNRSYTPGKKVWLNSKYIKMKKNKKLKSKFFGPFQVLHIIEKQMHQLKLPTKWKIHNVFHVLLLEQDITKKGQVDKTLSESKKDLELEARGNKEYKVKTIIDSIIYGQQANNSDQMLGLFYLVL